MMKYFVMAGLMCLALGCDNKPKSTTTTTTTPSTTMPNATPRDNTAVNERDADKMKKTPIDQNENQKDIDITANIRQKVVDTKMSVKAQNVKIITADGKTTLRGPVDNADEKKRIEDIANGVAGNGNVISELEIAAP